MNSKNGNPGNQVPGHRLPQSMFDEFPQIGGFPYRTAFPQGFFPEDPYAGMSPGHLSMSPMHFPMGGQMSPFSHMNSMMRGFERSGQPLRSEFREQKTYRVEEDGKPPVETVEYREIQLPIGKNKKPKEVSYTETRVLDGSSRDQPQLRDFPALPAGFGGGLANMDELMSLSPMSMARRLHPGIEWGSFGRPFEGENFGRLIQPPQSNSEGREENVAKAVNRQDVEKEFEEEEKRIREKMEEDEKRFFEEAEKERKELFDREEKRQRDHWKLVEEVRKRAEENRKKFEELEREHFEDLKKSHKLMEKIAKEEGKRSPPKSSIGGSFNPFAPPPPPLHPAHVVHNPRVFDTRFPDNIPMPSYHPYANPNHPTFPPLGPQPPVGHPHMESPRHYSPVHQGFSPVRHAHFPFSHLASPGQIPQMQGFFPPVGSAFHHYPSYLPPGYTDDSEFHPYGNSTGRPLSENKNEDIQEDPGTPIQERVQKSRLLLQKSFQEDHPDLAAKEEQAQKEKLQDKDAKAEDTVAARKELDEQEQQVITPVDSNKK